MSNKNIPNELLEINWHKSYLESEAKLSSAFKAAL